MGLPGLSSNRFDLLIRVRNFMLDLNYDTAHLLVAFAQKLDFYKDGYDLCMGFAEDEIVGLLSEKGKMDSLRALQIANSLKLKLVMRKPTRVPQVQSEDYRFEPTG